MEVINRRALVERFGEWPSFHDAKVYALRLDSGQRSDGIVRLRVDIHVFAVDGQLPNGRLNFVKPTLVTLEFEDVEALEIRGACCVDEPQRAATLTARRRGVATATVRRTSCATGLPKLDGEAPR